MLRRFRIGFLPTSVAARRPSGEPLLILCRWLKGEGGGSCSGVLTQSEPVCKGPYSHVTSESFSLDGKRRRQQR
jgi:hypothetical protein